MAAPKRSVVLLQDTDVAQASAEVKSKTYSVGDNLLLILRLMHGPRTPKLDRAQMLDAIYLDALQRAIERMGARVAALDERKKVDNDFMLFDDDVADDSAMLREQRERDVLEKMRKTLRAAFMDNGKPYSPYREQHMKAADRALELARSTHAKADEE